MADGKALALPAAGSNGVAPKKWSELSEPEQMAANARKALERVRDVLELELDPQNPRLVGIVTNVALVTLSQKIKLDETALSQREDRLAGERERSLRALVARLPSQYRPREDADQDLPEAREAAVKDSEPR